MKNLISKIKKLLKPYFCSHVPKAGRMVLEVHDLYVNEYFCIKCETCYKVSQRQFKDLTKVI